MDETIEVTHVNVEGSLKDKFAVTVLSAIACMVTSSLVEKSYFRTKAFVANRNSTPTAE